MGLLPLGPDLQLFLLLPVRVRTIYEGAGPASPADRALIAAENVLCVVQDHDVGLVRDLVTAQQTRMVTIALRFHYDRPDHPLLPLWTTRFETVGRASAVQEPFTPECFSCDGLQGFRTSGRMPNCSTGNSLVPEVDAVFAIQENIAPSERIP